LGPISRCGSDLRGQNTRTAGPRNSCARRPVARKGLASPGRSLRIDGPLVRSAPSTHASDARIASNRRPAQTLLCGRPLYVWRLFPHERPGVATDLVALGSAQHTMDQIMAQDLTDKVFLVAGATDGREQAAAIDLARRGASHELQRQLSGTTATAYCIEPGMVRTQFAAFGPTLSSGSSRARGVSTPRDGQP